MPNVRPPRKAFLLAAGLGTRLRPLTDTVPKCLVPIAGRPLLALWLDRLERAGVEQVLINLHHLPDRVREFLAEYSGPIEVHTAFEPALLGSAGTVRENWAFVDGEDDFYVLYADTLTDLDLVALARRRRRLGATLALALYRPESMVGRGSVVCDGDGRVERFAEKVDPPLSDLANAGQYAAGPELRAAIPESGPADFGYDVLPRLGGRMAGYLGDHLYLDIGTPDALGLAQSVWPEHLAATAAR